MSVVMIMRVILTACLITLGLTQAHAADRGPITVIVDRAERGVGYFISMPASGIEPLLAGDPSIIFSDNGAVPLNDFQQVGSFERADVVFANVTRQPAVGTVGFEAMSLMVHPTDTPLPFETPWDAMTAIAVCTVEYSPDQLRPGALTLFYGAYAADVDGSEPVSLAFPSTGREAVEVEVRHYHNGELVDVETLSLADGGSLEFRPMASAGSTTVLWAGAATLLTMLAGLLIWRQRAARDHGALSEG